MVRGRRIASMAGAALVLSLLVSPTPPVGAGHVAGPYFDLAALPGPELTGKQLWAGLKQFVADHPLRVTGTPHEVRAALALHQEMQGLGYETVTRSLAAGGVGVNDSTGAGAGLKVVMATKPGTTKPDEWIMFIGHHDTVPTTVEGAYDNAAGTSFIRYLAHEFKDVPTNRSLVFAWYNAEEEGLVASRLHADQLAASGQKVAAVLGFDMVGIAWPVKTEQSRNCLCIWRGGDDGARFDPLINHVNFTFLGFPNHVNKVRNRGANARNSDESSFEDRGFPTLRWAGMKTAANYVGYHKQNDTIDTIISEAGGEEYYEQGIENTLKSTYYTVLAIDNHLPVPSFTTSVSGRTVTLDATGSTDEDGALSSFAWDFGDGTTGEGATSSHTFGAPGTYTITLTVGDNLWPTQVRRSVTKTVTVT